MRGEKPSKIKAQGNSQKENRSHLGADERTCKFSMMSWLFMHLNGPLSSTRHKMTF